MSNSHNVLQNSVIHSVMVCKDMFGTLASDVHFVYKFFKCVEWCCSFISRLIINYMYLSTPILINSVVRLMGSWCGDTVIVGNISKWFTVANCMDNLPKFSIPIINLFHQPEASPINCIVIYIIHVFIMNIML